MKNSNLTIKGSDLTIKNLSIRKRLQSQYKLFRVGLLILLFIISYIAFTPMENTTLDTGFDKINHLIAFFVLSLFCQFSFPQKTVLYTTFLPLLSYAFFIEIVQYYLPYRTFSLLDVVADVFAVIAYLILSKLLIKN